MPPSRRTYFGWNTAHLLDIVLLGLGLSSLGQLDQGVVVNVMSMEWKAGQSLVIVEAVMM